MTTALMTLYSAVAAKTKELADAGKIGVLRSLAGESGLDVNLTAGKDPEQVRTQILTYLFGTAEPPETPGLADRLASPASIPNRLLGNIPQQQQQEGAQQNMNPNTPPGMQPQRQQQQQFAAPGVAPGQPQQFAAPQGMVPGQPQQFAPPPQQGFAPPPPVTTAPGMAAPMIGGAMGVPNQNQFVAPGQPQFAPPQGMAPQAQQFANTQQAMVQPGLPASGPGPVPPPPSMSPAPTMAGAQPQQATAPAQQFAGPPATATQQPDNAQSIMQEIQTLKMMVNGLAERQERFSNGMNILAERIMEIHAMCFYSMVRGVPAPWPATMGQRQQPFNMDAYKMYFPLLDDNGNMNGPLTPEQVQQLASQQQQG
jgi:hypothetical protein